MKKLNIIVMSLLFFTNFSTAVPPNMTSFSLLVNNISIVARITNAIALQTELMKNRTDIGAIIRELIPGQYDFLPLIRKLNVKKANEFLRWLVQEFTTMRSYNGKMTEDELREALHLVKFLTENVENLNMLKEYNKGSAEAFYDTVMDLNVINPFKLCDKDTLELVSSLYRLNSFSDLDQTGNILDLFRNLSSDKTLANLQDCFGKVQNFHGSLEKQPLYRSFIELNKIRKLKDVDKFFQQKSSRFASIGKITENMEEFMEKMKGIWSKLPLVSNSTNIDRLMFLCSDIWDYVTSGRAPKRLTPGFIRPMDTIQVKEDLESSFFKNNIAKKKGVHRLTTALNYYLKFATESAKLEKAFADFVNFIKGEMPMIERMNQTLDTFFYFTAKNISARLKELTKDAHECSNKVVNPLGQNRFSQFEEAFNQPANILESLLMLKTVSKYGDDFFVPNMLLNMLNDFKMAEKKAEFDEETVVDWFKSYRERFDNHFTFDAVLFIHNFHDAVNSLDDNIKKFQKSKLTIQSFSVTDQIKSSSLFPVLECFKTKHFNFDLFRQTAIFLSNIVSFSENRMLVVTQSFFNQLNKIQEAQNNIYKVMEKEKKTADIPQSRVLLDFRNSLDLSQRFGKGVRVLREIDDIINQEKLLLDSANVSRSSLIFMRWEAFEIVENFFENPQMRHQKFQASLLALEKAANLSVNSNLSNTKSVFHAARKVIGFNITRKELTSVAEKLKSVHQFQDSIRLQELSRWNLDFASFRNILFGAGMAALPLNDQFDFFFGIRKEKSKLLFVNLNFFQTLLV
uniref:WSN domain-containing protein n=1 Tax=Caenorhabditis japonica TaxID=281687 RepID=A0A8R1HI95_CAEJA